MNYQFKASITIPTFNRQQSLQQILEFLDQQESKYKNNFEVIIADDGSTDNTKTFVEKKIKEKAYTYPLSYLNTNLTEVFGASIARNMGIKKAKGEYLLFLDDDFIPHKKWLNTLVETLEKGEKVIFGHATHLKYKLQEDLPIKIEEDRLQRLYELSLSNSLTELLTGNFALSRECIQICGLFDERFARQDGYGYEDIEFGHRLIIGGFKIHYSVDALAYMPANPEDEKQKKEKLAEESKKTWLEIINNPQENLPITPFLKEYAKLILWHLKEHPEKNLPISLMLLEYVRRRKDVIMKLKELHK